MDVLLTVEIVKERILPLISRVKRGEHVHHVAVGGVRELPWLGAGSPGISLSWTSATTS